LDEDKRDVDERLLGPGSLVLNTIYSLGKKLDDDQGSWNLKATRDRRQEILDRLHVLCYEDGALKVFDEQVTSLPLAISLGRPQRVRKLLSSHLDGSSKANDSIEVNERLAKSGWTPLHLAYQAADCPEAEEIKQILLQAGADEAIRDKNDLLPKECRSVRPNVDVSGA
jgi:hypothetical protein